MIKRLQVSIIISMVCLATGAFAQFKADTLKYSAAALKDDFRIFRSSLEDGDAGLYRYISKEKVTRIFDEGEASIKSMDIHRYQIKLSRIAEQIGDGHLAVLAPKVMQDKFDHEASAIPFQPYFRAGKLYVLNNFSSIDDKGFVGAQILSINGHSTADILRDIVAIMPADGHNETYKYHNLMYPKYFSRYFIYLYGDADSYSVKYSDARRTKTVKLPGLLSDDLNARRDRKYPVHFLSDPLVFNLAGNTAYLKIESFDGDALEQKKLDLPAFLSSAFKRIDSAKAQNLILDLRNNHGGEDEFGKLLVSYLLPHDFKYYSSLTLRTDSFSFAQYTNMRSPKVPASMIKVNSKGTFDVLRHPNVGIQKPLQPNFGGKIYVLINGGCFSTTSECISMIHSNTNATFIGEESGGGYFGNNSGMVPELTLPNTKIRVDIPLMKYVMAVKDYPHNDRGLFPDHVVIPTIADKVSGRDVELEFTRALIKL